MDTKLKVLFIISCIVGIITVIFASLIASVLYKREQYLKNPYYFCDGTWECCKNESGCDVKKSVEDIKASGLDTYYVSDIFTEGSAYHQNCILPVMNYVNNFDGSTGVDLSGLYNGESVQSFVYGKGCSGPGGSGKCNDPSYNPQTVPSCKYHSFDAPKADWSTDFIGSNTLANGGKDPTLTTSMNYQYWVNPAPGSGILDNNNFGTIQSSNGTYTKSWNPSTYSGSNFTVPLQNQNIDSSANTFCYGRYNVLRPGEFTNSAYITGCTGTNAPIS